MEDSPCEAIKNNVIGTYKTAYAAMAHGCKRFVLISTDKAVNPTNIMGASKRLCEMVIQAFDKKVREGRPFDMPTLYTHNGEFSDPVSKLQLPIFAVIIADFQHEVVKLQADLQVSPEIFGIGKTKFVFIVFR